jgi:hypothetical protein
MELTQEVKDSLETSIDLDELAASVNDLEDHVKSLESKNVFLKSTLQNKAKHVSDTESLVKNLHDELSDQLSECKDLTAQLKKESFLLKQDYTELYKLVGGHNSDPLLLFQLPLHSYKADKQAFENHVKNFIIKQFEEVSVGYTFNGYYCNIKKIIIVLSIKYVCFRSNSKSVRLIYTLFYFNLIYLTHNKFVYQRI